MGCSDPQYPEPHSQGSPFSEAAVPSFTRSPKQVERTRHAVKLFQTGEIKTIGHKLKNPPRPPDLPPRETLYTQNIVGRTSGRKKTHGATLHALANLEQWA